ncbi:hypothetical protein CYMTET_46291, partial [Cymbomonas tetramitiformis]
MRDIEGQRALNFSRKLWPLSCCILLVCCTAGESSQQELMSGEEYVGSVTCDESHTFRANFSVGAATLELMLDAVTDPSSGVSSVLLEVSRESNFSTIVASAEGAVELSFKATDASSYGSYFFRMVSGNLYCPAGYGVQVVETWEGRSAPLNLTVIFQTNVRSRLMPVNKYDSMCDMEYYDEKPEKCVGGADRRAGYINAVKAATANVVCIDGGNAVVGTTFFAVYDGEADAELLLNYVPFDVYVPQHFEFNNGEAQMSKMLSFLNYRTDAVLSNVQWTDTILEASSLQRYAIKEYAGRMVGFLGFVSEKIYEYAPLLSDNFVVNPDVRNEPLEVRVAAQLALVMDEIQQVHPACNIFVVSGFEEQDCEELLKHSERISICFSSAQTGDTDWDQETELPHQQVRNAVGNTTLLVTGNSKMYGRGLAAFWVDFDSSGLPSAWGGNQVIMDEALNVSDAE